jgi:phosphoglycerate dehydrogenase-like enzyme
MKTKVLFIWKPPPELKSYLRKGLKDQQDIELIFPEPAGEDQFLKSAPEVDIIVGWRPSEKLLEQARKLRLFINPGAGIKHHIARFRKLNETRKVILVNGHGNSYFTAQHGVALLLALTNKVIPHHNWMVQGKWRLGDAAAASLPLRRKTVGLLGYGAVNRKIHRFLQGFDLSFAVLKNSWQNSPAQIKTFVPKEMDDFLKTTDILFVAVPQTSVTEDLIKLEHLKLIGTDGLLIQLSRGSIVNEEAIFTALKQKVIAGAAIDVWYDYQPDPDEKGRKFPWHFPFHELENVILSPHRAASPFSDLERWDEVIENISRCQQGRTDYLNLVDLEREY